MKVRATLAAWAWMWTVAVLVGPVWQDRAGQAVCYADTEEQGGKPAQIWSIDPEGAWSIDPEEVFGPLPEYETVITGIDAQALAERFLPEDAVLRATRLSPPPWGVGLYYCHETGEGRVNVGVGIFEDQEAAAGVIRDRWLRDSMPLGMFPGLGDRACLSGSTVGVMVNNAVIWVYWDDRDDMEAMLSIGKLVVEQLKTSEEVVSRSARVEWPQVTVELPTSVGLGGRATGSVLVENADPASVLLSTDSRNVIVRPGEEPRIRFYAPRVAEEAGYYTFNLYLATPTNVIASRQVSILVEQQ